MNKVLGIAIIFSLVAMSALVAKADEQAVPMPGTVTMVDLGSKNCIPCKMMAPILEKLEKFYGDKAAIRFIDVKEDPAMGAKYEIRTIPTQIFYDRQGKERARHEGFMEEKAIKEKIDELLAE